MSQELIATALVRFVSASEVGIKSVLLKPVIFGLVHNEPFAGFVTDLTLTHTGIDRFHGIDERIAVEGYVDAIGFYAEVMRRAASNKTGESK